MDNVLIVALSIRPRYMESFVQNDNNGAGIGNSPFPDIMMHVLLDEVEVPSPIE